MGKKSWVEQAKERDPLLFEMERQKLRAEEAEALLAEARELIGHMAGALGSWHSAYGLLPDEQDRDIVKEARAWLAATAQEAEGGEG